MSKTVVIHQPDFLPYLGFFHRLIHADLWVVLDDVQFLRKGWHNRDKIKTPAGEKWITVAVKKAERTSNINKIFLSTQVDWRTSNMNLIIQNYKKAPYFNEISSYVEDFYKHACEKLIEFNLASIDMLLEIFGVDIPRIFASELKVEGEKNELMVNILRAVNSTTYLSGIGARNYFDPLPFEDAGINVLWQDFKHPVYPQMHGAFIPYLSSIDLLFNCGIVQSRKILRSC